MQRDDLLPADYSLVGSRPAKYYSTLLDTARWRSVHCVSSSTSSTSFASQYNISDLPLIQAPEPPPRGSSCTALTVACGAIHRAHCEPMAHTGGSYGSLSTPKGNTMSAGISTGMTASNIGQQGFNHRASNLNRSTSAGRASTPTRSSNGNRANTNNVGMQPNPQCITDSEAIQLLAKDVESRLEALLRTFIQEEKLRQQARQANLMGRRSMSLTSLNQNFTGVQPSNGYGAWNAQESQPSPAMYYSHGPGLDTVSRHTSGSMNSSLSGSCNSLNSLSSFSMQSNGQLAGQTNGQTARQPSSHRLGRRSNSSEPVRESNISQTQPRQSPKVVARSSSPAKQTNSNIYSRPKGVIQNGVTTPNQSADYTKNLFGSPSKQQTTIKSNNRSRSASPTPMVNSLSNHLIQQLSQSQTPAAYQPYATLNNKNAITTKKNSSNNLISQPKTTTLDTLVSTPSSSNFTTDNKNSKRSTIKQSIVDSSEPLSRRVAAVRDQEVRRLRKSLSDANNNVIGDKLQERPLDRQRSLENSNIAAYSIVSETKHKWEQRENGTEDDQHALEALEQIAYDLSPLPLANPSHVHAPRSTSSPHLPHQPGSSTTLHHRHNPVKPFLTKGSVAERVLLFEKRPTFKQPTNVTQTVATEPQAPVRAKHVEQKSPVLYGTWRNQKKEVVNLARNFEQNLSTRTGSVRSHSNCWGSGYGIPRFYFPNGKPPTAKQLQERLDKIIAFCTSLPERIISKTMAAQLCNVCGLPQYWKEPFFSFASQGKTHLSAEQFVEFWKRMCQSYHDEAAKFVYILGKGRARYLMPEDFVPMIQDVINTHPGLSFLKDAYEFHSRYVHTVIARIFYCVNRSWSGKITSTELRRSNFLQVVRMLETAEDINSITDYFSYEHFYVIYCKFWELDKDHDLVIDKYDLSRHNDGAISSRMIERIFSGAVTRGQSNKSKKQMTYQEFVYFLISEEDKRQETAIEYWFRCLDLDGDGFLSLYELEYFYEEQVKRMEGIGIEALPFNDCICQMLDMINPAQPDKISLTDLKKCRMTPIFLDTFFNLDKYLDHEQRDPFANKEDQTTSDWDRYASEEYEILVAEENGHNQSL